MKKLLTVMSLIVLALMLTACGGTPSLVGNWKADDGTGMKVIAANGRCSGMYYNRGEPLDIGGGMSCSMSSKKNARGRYSLVVTQPPNETTLYVAFDGDDKAKVYDADGDLLFTMTRQ